MLLECRKSNVWRVCKPLRISTAHSLTFKSKQNFPIVEQITRLCLQYQGFVYKTMVVSKGIGPTAFCAVTQLVKQSQIMRLIWQQHLLVPVAAPVRCYRHFRSGGLRTVDHPLARNLGRAAFRRMYRLCRIYLVQRSLRATVERM